MQLIVTLIIVAAVCGVVTLAALLVFAYHIAQLFLKRQMEMIAIVDSIHLRHLEDTRYHVQQLIDQCMAISDSNLDLIKDRLEQASEADRKNSKDVSDLLTAASELPPEPDYDIEADLSDEGKGQGGMP
ncbi:MAG: hypothetical protein HRU13_13260 [Phycisphaerales bacterium]|nr:hypothetical protein [Phycisphaerales bacterium]